jgi:hypothetical protein
MIAFALQLNFFCYRMVETESITSRFVGENGKAYQKVRECNSELWTVISDTNMCRMATACRDVAVTAPDAAPLRFGCQRGGAGRQPHPIDGWLE